MKKITLILSLLITAYSFAQNISTGQVTYIWLYGAVRCEWNN